MTDLAANVIKSPADAPIKYKCGWTSASFCIIRGEGADKPAPRSVRNRAAKGAVDAQQWLAGFNARMLLGV
jgi:hypothetical protein